MIKFKIKIFFLLLCFSIVIIMLFVTVGKNEQLFLKYMNISNVDFKSITILYNTDKYNMKKGTAEYDEFYLLICDFLQLLRDESPEFQRGMLTAGIYSILYDSKGFYLELGIGYSKQQSKIVIQIFDKNRNSIIKYYNVETVSMDFIFSKYNLLIKKLSAENKK